MTNSKCVIYTRVSSTEQRMENYSIETQIFKCLQKAKELGYSENQIVYRGGVAESSKDIEGRKIYKDMITYVCDTRNNVKALIVYSTDRYSRHLASAANDILKIVNKKAIIYAIEENIDTSTKRGITEFFSKINDAQKFIDKLSERTKAGIQYGMESGRYPFAKAPRGYSKNKEIKNIVINQEGYLIREAFKMLIQGYTMSQIQDKMKSSNLDIHLKRWSEIFRNPVYAGVIISKDNNQEYKGKFECLISKLEFEQVQKILANKYKPRVKNVEHSNLIPLKAMVKCECGATMTGYVNWNKQSHPAYYICSNDKCRTNINATKINNNYNNLLQSIELDNSVKNEFINQIKLLFDEVYDVEILKKSNLKKGITLKNTQLDNLLDEKLAGNIENEIYQRKSTQYKTELLKLENELNSVDLEIPDFEVFIDSCMKEMEDVEHLWNNLNYDDQQQLYKLMFKEKPVLKKEGNVIVNVVMTDIFSLKKYNY